MVETFETARKGYGLRTVKRFEQGDLILEDSPLILAPASGDFFAPVGGDDCVSGDERTFCCGTCGRVLGSPCQLFADHFRRAVSTGHESENCDVDHAVDVMTALPAASRDLVNFDSGTKLACCGMRVCAGTPQCRNPFAHDWLCPEQVRIRLRDVWMFSPIDGSAGRGREKLVLASTVVACLVENHFLGLSTDKDADQANMAQIISELTGAKWTSLSEASSVCDEHEVLRRWCDVLRESFIERARKLLEDHDDLAALIRFIREKTDPEYFDLLCGKMALNASLCRVSSPLDEFFGKLSSTITSDGDRESVLRLVPLLKHVSETFPSGFPSSKSEFIAIFPTHHFANHSCLPSAEMGAGPSGKPPPTVRATLYSLSRIEAGSEVTISYVDPKMSLLDRHQNLRDMYLFDCDCEEENG